MGRRRIKHRSNHRRHRTLRLSTQILQMENHRQLPNLNRSALIDILSIYSADADLTTRLLFEVFIGSSIFLAFFMATDPATTPLSGIGQIIFGVGFAVLTILIQTYMNFFGGSLLALLIMNLTVPLLDRVGIRKPFGR